jgi:hypothetical protein
MNSNLEQVKLLKNTSVYNYNGGDVCFHQTKIINSEKVFDEPQQDAVHSHPVLQSSCVNDDLNDLASESSPGYHTPPSTADVDETDSGTIASITEIVDVIQLLTTSSASCLPDISNVSISEPAVTDNTVVSDHNHSSEAIFCNGTDTNSDTISISNHESFYVNPRNDHILTEHSLIEAHVSPIPSSSYNEWQQYYDHSSNPNHASDPNSFLTIDRNDFQASSHMVCIRIIETIHESLFNEKNYNLKKNEFHQLQIELNSELSQYVTRCHDLIYLLDLTILFKYVSYMKKISGIKFVKLCLYAMKCRYYHEMEREVSLCLEESSVITPQNQMEAWNILIDPNNSSDYTLLQEKMHELGITEAGDLILSSELLTHLNDIIGLLQPKPQAIIILLLNLKFDVNETLNYYHKGLQLGIEMGLIETLEITLFEDPCFILKSPSELYNLNIETKMNLFQDFHFILPDTIESSPEIIKIYLKLNMAYECLNNPLKIRDHETLGKLLIQLGFQHITDFIHLTKADIIEISESFKVVPKARLKSLFHSK